MPPAFSPFNIGHAGELEQHKFSVKSCITFLYVVGLSQLVENLRIAEPELEGESRF
jgi:hypothetical protein